MNPAALDRLFEVTRERATQYDHPLLSLFYWSTFLQQYLRSGIDAPVYRRASARALEQALDDRRLRIFDPLFIGELHALAVELPSLAGDGSAALRTKLERLEPPRWSGDGDGSQEALSGMRTPAGADLAAPIAFVIAGGTLCDRLPHMGMIGRLRIQAFSAPGAAGQITWKDRLVPDSETRSLAHAALGTVIRFRGLPEPRLGYEVRVDGCVGRLTGDSIGLPLAMIFDAYEMAERRKPHRIPRGDTAYIGCIDFRGDVLGVSTASLGAKIRAAAGAGLSAVVLPQANLSEAQETIAALASSRPALPLPKLIPVGNLREAVEGEPFARPPTASVRARVARDPGLKLAKRALWLGAGSLACWLAAPFVWPGLWVASRLHIPDVFVTSPRVVVQLRGFPLASKTWNFDSPPIVAEAVQLTDHAPPVLLVGTNASGAHPASLFAYDIRTKHLLWEKDFSRRAPLSAEAYSENGVLVDALTTVDLDGDGDRDIIAVARMTPMCPCFVIWLDADGTERGYYAHRGYLFHPTVADYNGDGKPEVFLFGISNGDEKPLGWRGTMVVLNAAHFSGWPGDGLFADSGIAPYDSCVARVIFPPIPDHCAMTDSPGYDVGQFWIRAGTANPTIAIQLITVQGPGLVATLNKDYEPINIVPEDALLPIVRRALEAGRIGKDFTSVDAMREYMKTVEVRR